MYLPMEELRNYDFVIHDVQVIRRIPNFRQIRQNYRKVNGFIYLIRGKCRFSYEGEAFYMEPGAVAYVPLGSRHVFDILTEDTVFYRVNFSLHIAGELALFSKYPVKLCGTAPKECAEAIRSLSENYEYSRDSVAKTELMCTILRSLSAVSTTRNKERLAPAVAYLLEHLTEKADCKHLATLCNLGTARFYALFQQEYCTTPLAYRNSLLMHRAVLLLQEGSLSVTEIAETLGFESAAYFSRFFKKSQGVAPSKYLLQLDIEEGTAE